MSTVTTTAPLSKYAIRAKLEEMLVGDLLGPAGGPNEELTERKVRDRYVIGVLAPSRRNAEAQPVEQEEEDEDTPQIPDELAEGGRDTADDGATDRDVPAASSRLPSTIGMTFCVDSEATRIKVTGRWGQYLRESRPDRIDERTGRPILLWQRYPKGGPNEVPLAIGSFGALLGLLSFAGPAWGRRDDDDEEALARLLTHFLEGPRGGDTLHLRHRPFFPTTLGKRRLSLADLERLGAAGRLFAAHPFDPQLRYLRAEVPVVDDSAANVRALLSLVPESVRLKDLAPVLRGAPEPFLLEVEAALRELDHDVRVHLAPGEEGVREVELPVRPQGLPPRHLLVGKDDARWAELADQWRERPALARFRLLRWLLEDTTLYREQRDGLLARLGREAVL
jgi:hypothetical protein